MTGAPPETSTVIDKGYSDIRLVPDPSTIRLIPWYKEPTAVVICDGEYLDGTPVDFAPRAVLRRVLEQFKQRNMRPVIAPELEFYLVKTNTDPDYPLEPPTGISGRQDSSHQAFGIEAVNEFDPVTEDIYDFCEKMRIDIDTLAHESGAAQMEINFNHGDPMELCDQVFLFKRAVRTAALQHQIYATFMAKPHQSEPGSAMHVHQSVVDLKSGKNIFAKASGERFARIHELYRRATTLYPSVDAVVCAECEFVPSSGAVLRCADQHAMGSGQPHMRTSGSGVGVGGAARGESRGRRRRQCVSRSVRDARLRTAGHDRKDHAVKARDRKRLSFRLQPAQASV